VAVYGVNNVGPTIAAVGTPAQRAHLEAIAAVDELWCQGFSEPDHGSDLAGLTCRADRDGDEYVINGQKIWTSIGMQATHCMLLVRTDPQAPKHKGISALLVPLDRPGIERRPITQITGEKEFAELFFTDVRVPTSALLGPENDGWRVTMTTLGYERSGILAMAGSLASDAERLIDDLTRRGDLSGATLQRAMRIYTRARLLRITGQRSLDTEGAVPGPLSTLIKQEFASLMKGVAELAIDTGGMAALLHDGPGVAREFLRSPSAAIAGGTTEVLKNLVGERVLGLPKEPQL
jgi:alkylation response protein AidB-like acyl-CoA dehydrogenase